MMQSMTGMRASMQMAKDELKYGKDQKVIGLARSIIAAQQREIDEMGVWLH